MKSSFSFLILVISLVFFWINLARGSSVWLFSSNQVLVSLTLLWVFFPLFPVQFLFLYLLFIAFFFNFEEGFVYSIIYNIMCMEINFNFSHVYHILKINLIGG